MNEISTEAQPFMSSCLRSRSATDRGEGDSGIHEKSDSNQLPAVGGNTTQFRQFWRRRVDTQEQVNMGDISVGDQLTVWFQTDPVN